MTSPGAEGLGTRRRVILADDDADLRDLVGISVARAGLELIGAYADGDAALSAVMSARPDVVLLDVSMPGLSGLEVCRAIRAEPTLAGVRVLLISAAVTEQAKQDGFDAGADEYLVKPFSPRSLVERLVVATSPVPAAKDLDYRMQQREVGEQ